MPSRERHEVWRHYALSATRHTQIVLPPVYLFIALTRTSRLRAPAPMLREAARRGARADDAVRCYIDTRRLPCRRAHAARKRLAMIAYALLLPCRGIICRAILFCCCLRAA